MPSEEMKAAAQMLREAGTFGSGEIDLVAMRAEMEQMSSAISMPDDVSRKNFDAGGIKACHIGTPNDRTDRGVLYFHGGGYVLGSLDTHAELMGRIARTCRAPVLGIDYRLAPEHPYPAAVEDAVASFERLIDNGIAPERIVIAGDSAGGGLTLACLLELKARGKQLPAGAVLLSPWTDLSGSGDSIKSRADADPMISPAILEPMAALYRGSVEPSVAGLSPLFGDLSGLPPLLIQVGDDEILLDDSTRLAQKAEAAGLKVRLQIFEGAFHVFQNMPDLPESAEAMVGIGAFFDEVTGP